MSGHDSCGWLLEKTHPCSLPLNVLPLVEPERTVRSKKKAGSGSEPALLVRVGLLRRRCCSDRLQDNRTDPGADDFTGDDQFHSAILLAPFRGVVRRDGPRLSETMCSR